MESNLEDKVAVSKSQRAHLLRADFFLISVMMVIAGCGIVYEFLLSHYAGHVLGAVEVAMFGVFAAMIASMGVGALMAQKVKDAFTAFAWLELAIGIIGSGAVLFVAVVITVTKTAPALIAETYGVGGSPAFSGGLFALMQSAAMKTPYVVAFVLGALIGAEIPLVGRVREHIYGRHLSDNVGTIYGMDYIGASIGAVVWVAWMMTLEITTAAALTGLANLSVGIVFYILHRKNIRFSGLLLAGHLVSLVLVLSIMSWGGGWERKLEDMLYKDQVVYRMDTKYQRIVVTKRIMDPRKAPVYALNINGHMQFSSYDEHIYHSLLVYPAMLASARHDDVLIVGGGDGLALRDVLKWNPKSVTLLDLDRRLVDLFAVPKKVGGEVINMPLLRLNKWSFSDPRVHTKFGDAFINIDDLIASGRRFDAIIVDLPDPNHPNLNKLYSATFYAKLKNVLAGDGAISIQSTSPYHAREAFKSIGKTVKYAGFQNVEQYHANVPSFGEWGWTIATPHGLPARERIARTPTMPIPDDWLTKGLLLGAFEFNKGYYDDLSEIKVNRANSNVVYKYYFWDWKKEYGVFSQ